MSHVKGLTKVIAGFTRAEKKLTDEEMKERLQISGDIAADKAREIVPVDTHELQRSIHATEAHKKAFGWEIEVKAEKYYSIFVELGTCKQRAQPYLKPALENSDKEIRDVFSDLGLD